MAYEICKNLNTQIRRDTALKILIQSSISNVYSEIDMSFIISIVDEIYDNEIKGEAIGSILKRISEEIDDVDDAIKTTLKLIDKVKQIGVIETQCFSICYSYIILSKDKTQRYDKLKEHLLKLLDKSWSRIDIGWNKVDIGFRIVILLSGVNKKVAKVFFETTEKYKEEIEIDSDVTAETFIFNLRLAIRAFSGLIPTHAYTNADLSRLTNLIDQIPSYGQRAEIWAELALRIYKYKETTQFNRIVTEHVIPLLEYIEISNNQYWNDLIISLSPALYYNHKLTTFEIIERLYTDQKDEAYISICNFIITRQTIKEPYSDSKRNGYDIEFIDIVDLCEILTKMKKDSYIYYIIEAISETLHYKKNRFTKQQVADISVKLTKIINDKLPDKSNILHDGYKIIANAQVARFNRSNIQYWNDLISSAKMINNLADRSFVLCTIATLLPSSSTILAKQILNESKNLIDNIPSIFDRISHYDQLASIAWNLDQVLSKKCLQTAMKIATENNDLELIGAQRRIIDLAHRLDTELASTLASLADNDNARVEIKENIKMQNRINELKKQMSDKNYPVKEGSYKSDYDYCNAAWKLLASLNSGGVEPIHSNDSMKYIDVVSRVPLTKAYPILAWIIENSIRRHSKTDYVKIIRQMFESTLLGTELSLKMVERSTELINKSKKYAIFYYPC